LKTCFLFSFRQQGDANPDARARRCRQDDDPVQVEVGPVRKHNSDRRFQRRNRHLQKRQIQRLGKAKSKQRVIRR